MNITTDTRLNFCKCHIGVRTFLNPLSWQFGLPFPPCKWWINPFFGPVELTLYTSWTTADWFSLQTSIGFEWAGKKRELRFHPLEWRVSYDVENLYGSTVTSRWVGPFWIYTTTDGKHE